MAIFRLAELHLGERETDREHQVLLQLILELERAQRGNDLSTITDKLAMLLAAARRHFHHEEMLMQEANYSGAEIHRRAHEVLLTQLQTLNEVTASGTVALGAETLAFLFSWFYDHIATLDRPLAEFLLARAADPLTIASQAAATGTSP
jgi:hemerythrin